MKSGNERSCETLTLKSPTIMIGVVRSRSYSGIILMMFVEYFSNDRNIQSLISANAVPGWMYTQPSMNLKTPLTVTFTRQTSPTFESVICKFISAMSQLTLLQSVKLLMLRYMATPPAMRLDDDDTASGLRLAVLRYDSRSNPGTCTGFESSIHVSLIAK